MTVQLEKDPVNMACLKGLPGESSFSPKIYSVCLLTHSQNGSSHFDMKNKNVCCFLSFLVKRFLVHYCNLAAHLSNYQALQTFHVTDVYGTAYTHISDRV